jgi:hypothetical protein
MQNSADRLRELESELQSLLAAEKELRQQYIEAAGALLKQWFLDTARSIVTKQLDVTDRLDDAQVRELRAQITALADHSSEIAFRHFSTCKCWADLSNPESRTLDFGIAHEALKAAAVEIAPTLTGRGYRMSVADKTGIVRMGESLAENAQMESLAKQYGQLWGKFCQSRNEKQSLERKEKEANAAKRWDSL